MAKLDVYLSVLSSFILYGLNGKYSGLKSNFFRDNRVIEDKVEDFFGNTRQQGL